MIHKTILQPILKNAVETPADTNKTTPLVPTAEMETHRTF